AQRNVLHDVQRRARICHAGGRGDCAGQAGRENHRPDRRRIEHVLDPGLMERRATCPADLVHRSQEPALRCTAGVCADVWLRPGRTAARNRAARYRFRGARPRPGMSWRKRQERAALARCAGRRDAGNRSDAGGSGHCLSRFIARVDNHSRATTRGGTMSITSPMSRSVVALIAACIVCAHAAAQTWPDKPVKLLVNFPPGGVADTLARAIATGVSEAIKQPVVVENRPGANGAIGADAVAKSPADGYTFLVTSGGAMTVDPFIYSNLPYDTQKDLAPVASLAI